MNDKNEVAIHEPTISVMIPVLNGEAFLGRAIQSVLNQNFTDLELVVVDNCSTDRTNEIAQSYSSDARVKVFRNDSTVSMYSNFNTAFKHSSGRYLKFLCADDYLAPHALENYLQAIETSPEISLVTAYARVVDQDGSFVRDERIKYAETVSGNSVVFRSALFMTNRYCNTPSHVFFRRSDFERVGMFDETDGFNGWGNDGFTFLKIIKDRKVSFIPQQLLFREEHKSQATAKIYRSNLLSKAHNLFRSKMLDCGLISKTTYLASKLICSLSDPLLVWLKRMKYA